MVGGPELLILLVLILIPGILVTFLAVRRTSENRGNGAGGAGQESRDAQEILNERYARGEIGREDYRRMRQDIEG